jgi:alcohol dehydrogenase class IV
MEVCQADFARLSHLLFGRNPKTPADSAAAFLLEIEKLCDRVGVPRRLAQVGVTRAQVPALVKSSRGSSMSGNPRELSDAELTAILEGLL